MSHTEKVYSVCVKPVGLRITGPAGPGTVEPALSLFLFPFFFQRLFKKQTTMLVGMKD